MAWMTRRRLLVGGAVAVAAVGAGTYWVARPKPAPIGFAVSPDELSRARTFLQRHPSVDAHAHPGRTFVAGAEHLSGLVWVYAKLGHFEPETVAQMRSGGLSAAVFAAVSDFQALGLQGEGLAAVREFEPGEAWASYQRQIGNLKALADTGLVFPVKTVADVQAAHDANKVGAILGVEGGDFLEGMPQRVAQAFSDGVRVITLMHYRNNELGDIMTGAPVRGGLSKAGAAVIQAMNEIGMLVDVAHASEATAMGAIRASSRPVMASHAHVNSAALAHQRFISRDLARQVAQTGGGVVGAWPAGIGITDLKGFVERTFDLIDAIGIDHVCLGTDMDANYKPVFDNYANLPHYVAGLFQHGLSETEAAKLIGGNFLRVFAAVQAV